MKKKLFYLPIFLLLFCNSISAQISEADKSMSKGMNPALILEIPGTTEKLVNKMWKKEVKAFKGKTKKDKKQNEWFTDNAIIVTVAGTNAIDLFARINGSGQDVTLTVWFELADGFLNSSTYPDEWLEAEKMMMRFGLDVAREQTKIELEEQEKKLKKFVSNLNKLQKDNERYHKEIERAKATIAKMEANIEQNLVDQSTAEGEIEAQQIVVDDVKQKLSDL